MCVVYFFFFKQKTAYELRISDWSSDVCSSDLSRPARTRRATRCGTSSTPGGRKSATAWSTSPTIRASASRSNGRRWSGIGRDPEGGGDIGFTLRQAQHEESLFIVIPHPEPVEG